MSAYKIEITSGKFSLALGLLLAVSLTSASGQTERSIEQEDFSLIQFLSMAQSDHILAEEIGLTQKQKIGLFQIIAGTNRFNSVYSKFLYRRSVEDATPEEMETKKKELQSFNLVVLKKVDEVLLPQQIQRARELVRQSIINRTS